MRCSYCSKEGHRRDKCKEAKKVLGTTKHCKFCKKDGHSASECQEMFQARLRDLNRYIPKARELSKQIIDSGIGIGTMYMSKQDGIDSTFVITNFSKYSIFTGARKSTVVSRIFGEAKIQQSFDCHYQIAASFVGKTAIAEGKVAISVASEFPEWLYRYVALTAEELEGYFPPIGFLSFLTTAQKQKSSEIAERLGLPDFLGKP